MGSKIKVLSTLFSLLAGCAPKPAAAPTQPGASLSLDYPILLAGDRRLDVKDTQQDAITTNDASGRNFLQVKIIDSHGTLFEVRKVTPFRNKPMWLDMGTTPYQVFLELKRVKDVSVPQAKAIVMEIVREPHGLLSDSEHAMQVAADRIQPCQSLAELIEICRRTWEWR